MERASGFSQHNPSALLDAAQGPVTGRESLMTVYSDEGDSRSERAAEAKGTFSGIGARFSAFFASAGNMLKGLFFFTQRRNKKIDSWKYFISFVQLYSQFCFEVALISKRI